MEINMKKSAIKLVILLAAIFFLALFVFRITRKPLLPDDENLHESMELFFALDGEAVNGGFFQAQLLDACRIEDPGQAEQRGTVSSYCYTIAFAPLTDTPYQLTRVEVEPLDDAVGSYLGKYGTAGSSYSSSAAPAAAGGYGYDDLISALPLSGNGGSFPPKHEDFQAYALGITISDLGTIQLNNNDLSADDFEQGIRGIRLILHYGLWKTDELVFHFDGEWRTGRAEDACFSFLAPLTVYERE